MDENLRELVSMTMLKGVDYLDRTAKYLPREFMKETSSLMLAFQKLLQMLKETSTLEKPSNALPTSYEHIYEPVLATVEIGGSVANQIDNRKPIKIPANQSGHDYLAIQQNDNFTPSPDKPSIQLEVLVNTENKGMYYCLIDNGNLLLNRKLDTQNSEYVIPLELYSFRAVKDFKIKFTHNDLVIVLLFNSKIDCDVWLEYLFKAKQSIYSYASVPLSMPMDSIGNQRTRVPDLQLVSASTYPKFMRCWSTENILDLDMEQPHSNNSISDGIYLDESIHNANAKKIYENRLENIKHKPIIKSQDDSTVRSLGDSNNTRRNLKHLLKPTKSLPNRNKIKSNKIEYHNVAPLNIPPHSSLQPKIAESISLTKEDIYENNEVSWKQKFNLKKSK
ncbi:hypothetical protein LOD99_14819 [Oopsacas minuta]|uniref:PH domain-containing protein n=1 Tax=Oopsacas minuta TaxID=111878 RepID=A0AAV7KD42_9METZ|nr:hypothetical protein LOD99_14819 [Oopsacas minuta]